MKIAHVINSLEKGGAEKLLTELIPALSVHGVEVILICLSQRADDYFLGLIKNSKNVNLILLESRNVYNPLNILKLRRVIKKHNVELVHAHLFPSFYFLPVSLLLSSNKPKLFYTEHSTSNNRRGNFIFRLIDRYIYKQYDKIICISNGTLTALRVYQPKISSEVIYNGIDIKKLYHNKDAPITDEDANNQIESLKRDGKTIILTIGRIIKDKNHEFILTLLKELPDKYVSVICGEGPHRNEFEKLIQERGLGSRVILLGNVRNVARIVNKADLGLMPSLREGFGLAAAEMMALGLPVYLNNIPGLRELRISDEFVFETGQVNELAQRIENLLLDQSKYKVVQQNALDKMKNFSIEQMAQHYYNAYKKKLA